MIKPSLILLFIVSSFTLAGQTSLPSDNGVFAVNYLKGCPGTQIEVTPADNVGTPFICFDANLSDIGANNECFGPPAQTVDDFRFVYQEPGIYNILFLKQLTNTQVYDSITIEILDPAAPFVALSSCDQGLVLDVNPEQEGFDLYTVDFGDGSAVQEYSLSDFPFSYQYADPSLEFTLSVTGTFNDTGNNNCANNEFSRTFIPENQTEQSATISSVEMLSNNSFEIEYELSLDQAYQLQIKQNASGDYQNIASFSASEGGSYIIEGRDLNADFYCVRLVSRSRCDGQELLSNEVCTIRLQAIVELGGNLMNWNDGSFQNSDVLKNGEVIYSGGAPYLDENVFCGQVDEYQIRAIDVNGIEVISLSKRLAASTTGPVVSIDQIATNVLSDSELEIVWTLPAGLEPDQFVVYRRRSEEEDFFRLDTTSNSSYVDQGSVFTERIYYYSIAYLNRCGGTSPLETIAPNILLTVAQEGSVLNFEWNSFTGFGDNLTGYVLKKYDDEMNFLSENIVDTSTFYSKTIMESDNQLIFYQLEAQSEDGLIAYSNLVTYKIPSSFFVPSAFTPNGDGLNEVIKVEGNFIEEVEFSIYNRWGNLIFRSNALESGWDGFLPNRPAPEGTYSYTVRVQDRYGEEYFKTGIFNLIR